MKPWRAGYEIDDRLDCQRCSRLLAVATLRLFAQARELAGESRVDIDADTVGAVLDEARTRFGGGFAAVVENSKVWLNGVPAATDDPVSATDEVAILPPVSGG